ncbi:MAG: MarR family transcriptional regulator [Candidatus Norongarragalinales archaeon]
MLGWTQEEIAELFGLTRQAVSNIVKNLTSQIFSIREQFYERDKSVEEIAGFYCLDTITVWAIVLQGKDDLDCFRLFRRTEC